MVTKIKNKQVFNNVNQFRQILIENRSQSNKKKEDRIYLALLDLETGEMRFAKKISQLEPEFPRTPTAGEFYEHWKSIYLIVHEKEGMIHFDLWNSDQNPLKSQDLHQVAAWNVVSETVSTLNAIAQKVSRVALGELLPEDAILCREKIQLSSMECELKDLKEWQGVLDRVEAEKKLENRPSGSYLLRELDSVSESTVLKIAKDSKIFEIQACVMTLVQKDLNIREILLIGISDHQWTFYQDNVNLRSSTYTYYPSVSALIEAVIRGGLSADS